MSQKELSKLIEVVPNQISKYEKGLSDPPITKIIQLAAFFKVGLDDFILADLSKGETYDGRELSPKTQRLYEQIIAQHERELEQIKRAVRRNDPALAQQLGIDQE